MVIISGVPIFRIFTVLHYFSVALGLVVGHEQNVKVFGCDGQGADR